MIWFVLHRWNGGRGSGEVAAGVGACGRLPRSDIPEHQQSEAIANDVKDAETLAHRATLPRAEVGRRAVGWWLFLIALVLSLFGIGLILLAYMAIVRPDGTLSSPIG